MEDITQVLAFEVKKEMADRYFGFRKRIEDDSQNYASRLTLLSLELENNIGFALIRIYILLQKEKFITSFSTLSRLPKGLFYDPYLLESPTIRKRMFEGEKCRGLTKKQQFQNMLFDSYEKLAELIHNYHNTLEELTEEQETIREEINIFYRKNDIDTILSFIRRLDSPDSNVLNMMQHATKGSQRQGLSGQMRLHPPLPACEILPSLPVLPKLAEVKQQLAALAKRTFQNTTYIDLKSLVKKVD